MISIKLVEKMIRRGKIADAISAISQHPEIVKERIPVTDMTLLHVAAKSGDVEVCKLLLDLGADVNATFSGDSTPLEMACFGDLPTVQFLLNHGADVNLGRPIFSAISNKVGHGVEIAKVLLDAGLNPNKQYLMFGEHEISAVEFCGESHPEIKELIQHSITSPDAIPARAGDRAESSEYLGELSHLFGSRARDDISTIVHPEVAICIRRFSNEHCLTLVTDGLRQKNQVVAESFEHLAKTELYIQLPLEYQKKDLVNSPVDSWPVHWLLEISKLAAAEDTWLPEPLVLFENEKGDSFSRNKQFEGMLAISDKNNLGGMEKTSLFRLFPVYREEIDLLKAEGIPALMQAFDSKSIGFMVDDNRPSAVG